MNSVMSLCRWYKSESASLLYGQGGRENKSWSLWSGSYSLTRARALIEDQRMCLAPQAPTDLSCHLPKDKCADVLCGTHGQCSGDMGQCVCDEDWSGEGCHVLCPVDCGAHGSCAGQCACDVGWYGPQCSSFDICDTIACGAHGRCHSDEAAAGGTATATCVCEVGYGGQHCEQHSGGAALPNFLDGSGGTGAAALGMFGVLGIASVVRQKLASTSVAARDELSVPLATAV
jgi:hypothetical protein